MLRKIEIKTKALIQLQSLSRTMQVRIQKKLEYFASLPNPQNYAERLVDFKNGTYRYRVGDYRIIVDFDEQGRMIIVALIAHRREVYK